MLKISERLRSRPYHKTEFRTPESGGLLGLWMAYWKVHDPKVLETGVTDTCTMKKLAIKVGWHWYKSHPIMGKTLTPLLLTMWTIIVAILMFLFWVAPEFMAPLATVIICLFGIGYILNAAYDAAPTRFLDLFNILLCWFLAPAETVILAINMIMEADRRRFIRHILGWPVLTLMFLYVINRDAFWIVGKVLLISFGVAAGFILVITAIFVSISLVQMWREERSAKKYNARARATSLTNGDLWPSSAKPAKKKKTSFQLLRSLWHAIKMQACTKVEFEPIKVNDRYDD